MDSMTSILKSGALALAFCLLAASAAVSSGEHDALRTLMVDLDGWNATAVEGATLDLGTHRLITASREYRSGTRRLTATLSIGDGAVTMGPAGGGDAETDSAVAKCCDIGLFPVFTSFDKIEGQGVVVVSLVQDRVLQAVFTLLFVGMDESEALGLARSFNWDMMAGVSRSLL